MSQAMRCGNQSKQGKGVPMSVTDGIAIRYYETKAEREQQEAAQLKDEARKVAKASEVFRPEGDPGFFFFIGKALLKADMENKAKIKQAWPKMWEHYLGLWVKYEEIHGEKS